MKEKWAFISGTGLVSLSIGLIANAVGQAQNGSSWELPAKAATKLFVVSVASLFLDITAVAICFAADRFPTQGRSRRLCFWLALGVSLMGFVTIVVFEPGQWPNRSSLLSHAARTASIVIEVACLVFWIALSIGWGEINSS